MSFRLSASRIMKAREVIEQGKTLGNNAAILVVLESKVKHHFAQKNRPVRQTQVYKLKTIQRHYNTIWSEVVMAFRPIRDIENPMTIDALWRHQEQPEPKVIDHCAGCGEEVFEGQDIYEFNHNVIHADDECCRDFVANISVCKVAGV